jgi:two-component system KDP operon response regulator KdpE
VARTDSSSSGSLPLALLPEVTRVLIVEDNDELRRQLVQSFIERGYAVEAVRTLKAALEIAKRQRPHVVVTELLVPDARSYRFADAYRSAVARPLTILAVTRLPQLIFDSARRAGFDEVFAKPVDVETLIARVEHAVLERS